MLKKIILVLIISITQQLCHSQSYFVKDSISKKNIPYASIQYLNSDEGTYSNEKGMFYLNKNISDSIKISCLNYYPLKLAISELKDNIFLNPKVEILDEITITNKKKEKTIGLHKKSTNFSCHILTSTEFITSLKFKEDIHNTFITDIHIPIKKARKVIKEDIRALIRLNIYSDFKEKIYESEPKYCELNKSRLLSFDVSDALIEIKPNNLFVGVELLGFVNNRNEIIEKSNDYSLVIPFTHKKTNDFEFNTYLKLVFSGNKEWKPLNDITKEFSNKKKQYHLPIGLTLSSYD